MTDAKILEVARREINKGIEGARANGVVCGPILRLSVRPYDAGHQVCEYE